jgi:hypothetical protein
MMRGPVAALPHDAGSASFLPTSSRVAIRLLNQDEAAQLIRRFGRGIPKRPAVASVKRGAVKRKQPLISPYRRSSESRCAAANNSLRFHDFSIDRSQVQILPLRPIKSTTCCAVIFEKSATGTVMRTETPSAS